MRKGIEVRLGPGNQERLESFVSAYPLGRELIKRIPSVGEM